MGAGGPGATPGRGRGKGGRLQVADEPLFADRMAGLDISKAVAEVTVRVPGDTARGCRRQVRPDPPGAAAPGRLERALDCSFFTDQHAAVLAMMLATIDYYSAPIEALTATIAALIAPYLHQVEQLGAVHDGHVKRAQNNRSGADDNTCKVPKRDIGS